MASSFKVIDKFVKDIREAVRREREYYRHDWIPCSVDACLISGEHKHCQSYYPQHPNCSAVVKHEGYARYYPTYNQRRDHEIKISDFIRTGRMNDCVPEAYGYKSKKKVGMAGHTSEGRPLTTQCFHHIPKKELIEVRSVKNDK